ncbi:MAG: amidohydrolase family protein, partial [Actinomycetota bacterium]
MTPVEAPVSQVIDFRVRLPLELRPAEHLPADYLDQYDKVLDLSANRHRTLADLIADMAASGTGHAVVHAEYEYGDDADALNEAVGKLVSEQPDKFSGYGTISMGPVKIPRALAQVRRVAELGLTGLSLQPSFFGIGIDDRVLYPVYAKADELGLQVALHTGINYTVSFPIRNDQP